MSLLDVWWIFLYHTFRSSISLLSCFCRTLVLNSLEDLGEQVY